MTKQEYLCYYCKKEIECGCYDAKIDGISTYTLVRRRIRAKVLEVNGYFVMPNKFTVNKRFVLGSLMVSAWHLIKLVCNSRHYSTVFCAFPRIDKIQGAFLDKFTDPLIIQGGLKDNYIILDHGLAGVHAKPRLNDDRLIYCEILQVISFLYTNLFIGRFKARHKEVLNQMLDAVEKASEIKIDRSFYYKEVMRSYTSCKLYEWLLRKIKAQKVIGVARPFTLFIAAHKVGAKVLETQHGITYSETLPYSGYRDPLIVPDYFLAFGNNRPLDVYGIDESRIVNIGWALQEYIDNLPLLNRYGTKDILVISDPGKTDDILAAVTELAQAYLESTFYFRPHPHEKISDKHRSLMESLGNVRIQDNSINITEVMSGFNYVIGESSTVLYEALSAGKRVGKLFMGTLAPAYLDMADADYFWEIRTISDFEAFLNENPSTKKQRNIFSPFNSQLFNQILEE